MSGTNTAKKIVSNPFFSVIFYLSVCFILPRYGGRYGGIALMVACASLLSVHIAVLPELYRNRSGSMMTANCLAAVMWVGAAVVTVLTLMGTIQ